MIYNIDYRLIKEVSDIVYKKILINFDEFKKDLNSESSEENDNEAPYIYICVFTLLIIYYYYYLY